MINNRIELSKDAGPRVLITWHLAHEEGYYPIALQFSEDIDDETRQTILEIARRPLKIREKQFKQARCGSSDHFGALPRALARLGFRTRTFGASQRTHALDDRPIETP